MGFASTGRTRYYEELPILETLLQQRKSRSPTLVNNKTLPIPAVQVVGTAQRDVRPIQRNMLGPDHVDVATTYNSMGTLHRNLGASSLGARGHAVVVVNESFSDLFGSEEFI